MGEIGKGIEGQIELYHEAQKNLISPEKASILRALFKDDYEGMENMESIEGKTEPIDVKQEIFNMFSDDYFNSDINKSETKNDEQEEVDFTKQYEPNSKFEINGRTYETDDNGYIYKIDGYELIPDCEYTINGVTYKTDELGRIVSCDGEATSTPDGERDEKAQKMAGGEDRRPGDHGGHIMARIFGGAKGIENMLAMRGNAINLSVYSHIESKIKQALEEGKDVHVHVDVEYEGDSQRPSKITVVYTIDGKETVVMLDNDEGSIDLLDSLEDKISESDYQDLKDEIQEAKADGANISVVSVETEYDEDGNITKVTVMIRDENGEPHPVNEKRVYEPKEVV